MSTTYGIFSEAAGGTIDEADNQPAAVALLDYWVAEGEDVSDLRIVEMCEAHADQVAGECDECDAEEDDTESEETDDE